ncbi:MAG: DHA2 family efflux MFS transporter permease subunit [Rhodospirillaceae bacterium]|nr:DHA2 family efflux MFS transporter permease subunit [Rhodospirillaceae bacterium]MBT5193059.1 DHA2 family efflux MFS transporter permease subunit [Rhodospirillaceae bacterium]MBT5895641.1 DHA2 family efflux MFS transporter permease subunit [Rhodospirillaceae bacterium]MBT6427453.1 DHA2 family efflux MFS transporter permease subunit [Rhodospirillaceae bacterium]
MPVFSKGTVAGTMTVAAGTGVDALFHRYGKSYRWLVTLTVMTGAIAMGLASSMVNVAVPSVIGAFGVGLDQAQWMATGFLATMSATMLVSSWLIEVLGQRITFIVILTVFGIGSFLSATAPNIDILILGRVLQGAANGIGQPLAMYTMYSVFPADRRGTAIGIYGLFSVLAPTFGPIVGGIAIDSISWRYLFFLPLPFCVPALILGMVFMPGKKLAPRLPPFDWLGLALVLLILFSVLSGLANGPRRGWDSDFVVYRLLAGATALFVFILWELRATYPLLDLSLFRNRQFALTMIAGFVFGTGLFASGYFIPIFVQTIQNYSATRAGLLLAPGGLVMMLFFPLAGRITDTIPAHIPIAVGLLIFSIGFFLIQAVDVNTTFFVLVIYTAINKVGLSLAIPSLSIAALRAVPPDKLARAASASTFFRNLGGGIGITMLTAFFQHRTQFHAEALTETQTWANQTTRELLGGIQQLLAGTGLTDTTQMAGAINYLSHMVQAQASTIGFKDTFLAIAVMALFAVGPAWMIGHGIKRQRA